MTGVVLDRAGINVKSQSTVAVLSIVLSIYADNFAGQLQPLAPCFSLPSKLYCTAMATRVEMFLKCSVGMTPLIPFETVLTKINSVDCGIFRKGTPKQAGFNDDLLDGLRGFCYGGRDKSCWRMFEPCWRAFCVHWERVLVHWERVLVDHDNGTVSCRAFKLRQ